MAFKLFKWSALTILGLLVALALLIVSPRLLAPAIDPVRMLLVDMATSALSRSLNGRIEIGSLQGSLLKSPVVRNLRVEAANGKLVLSVDEVRLRYDLASLLSNHLEVDSLEILRPQLHLVETVDGTLNLVQAFSTRAPETETPPPGDAIAFSLAFSKIALEEGSVDLKLPSLAGVHSIDDLAFTVSGRLDQEGLGIELQSMTARAEPAGFHIVDLRGFLDISGEQVRLRSWILETEHSQITLAGTLPAASQASDLNLALQPLNTAEVGRLLGVDTLSGTISGDVQLEGPLDDLQLGGHLTAGDGRLDIAGRSDLTTARKRYQGELKLEDFDLSAVLRNPRLKSDLNVQANFKGEGSTVDTLTGELNAHIDSSKLGEIAISPSQISLSAEEQRIRVHAFNLDTSLLQAKAAGEIGVHGPSELSYEVRATLSDLRNLAGVDDLNGTVRLQGKVNGHWPNLVTTGKLVGTDLVYSDTHIAELDSSFKAMGFDSDPTLELETGLRSLRAGDATIDSAHLAGHYLHSEASPSASFDLRVQQSDALSSELAGTFKSTTTEGITIELHETAIDLGERRWSNAEPLHLTLHGEQVLVKPFRLQHGDESVEISGGLMDSRLRDVRVDARNIDLGYLRETFALPPQVQGFANLALNLEGSLEAPIANTRLTLQQPAQNDSGAQSATLSLAYAQQRLTGEGVLRQRDSEALRLDLALPVNLGLTESSMEERIGDGALALTLKLEQLQVGPLGQMLAMDSQLRGSVSGETALRGSFANLALDGGIEVEDLEVPETIESARASGTIAGTLVTAATVAEFRKALLQKQATITVENLLLKMPGVHGRLVQEGAAQEVAIEDLYVMADGGWTADGPNLEIQDAHATAQLADRPAVELSMAATLTPEQMSLKRLGISSSQSEISGQGSFDIPSQAVALGLDISALQLKELIPEFPETFPSLLQGEIDVSGTLGDPVLDARLDYADAEIHAHGKAALLESVPSYSADLRVSPLQLASFVPDLRGALSGDFKLQGRGITESERQASLALNLSSTDLAVAPGLSALARATLAGSTLTLEKAEVDSAPFTFDAAGTLSTSGRNELRYSLQLHDLGSVASRLDVPIDVRGRLDGQLAGPIDSLETTNTLQISQWQYAEWQGGAVNGQLRARNIGSSPDVVFDLLANEVQSPALSSSDLTVEGKYRQQEGTLTLQAGTGPFEGSQLLASLRNEADIGVTLGTVRLQHGDWLWRNPNPITGGYDRDGRLWIQDFDLVNDEQRLQFSGSLARSGRIAADAEIAALDIGSTLAIVAPKQGLAKGRLSANLKASGTLSRPIVDGQMQATDLRWQEFDLGELLAEITTQGSETTANARWLHEEKAVLSMLGRWNADRPRALNLSLQAQDFDLARLQPLSPEIAYSAGQLNMDLVLGGTIDQPTATGTLDLTDGALQLAALGVRHDAIQSEIVFSGRRMDIRRLEAKSPTGPASVEGWLELIDLQAWRTDINVRTDEFTAIETPATLATITSSIDIRGNTSDLAVTGRTTVTHARIRYEALPSSGPAVVEPWELTVEGVYGTGESTSPGEDAPAIQNGRQEAPDLPFLRADLSLDMPRNVWVHGSGTAIELRGDLALTKDLKGPFILSGTVDTVRGFATVLGRKFEIDTGSITFTGQKDLIPNLNVIAVHRVSDYSVRIDISGKSTKPDISFSSTPPLDEQSIISLLAFGRTPDKLSSSEQGTLSTGLAGGVAASVLENSLGSALGLDTVSVEMGGEDTESSVGVGQYITNDLFITFDRVFRDPKRGNVGGSSIGIEYNITPRLRIRGTGSDFGETAVDLIWGKDY